MKPVTSRLTLTLEGEYALNDQFYAIAELASLSFDGGIDAQGYALGLGHSYDLGGERSLAAEARVLYESVDTLDSETGFSISGIYATPISAVEGLELEAELSLTDMYDDTDWAYELGLSKSFTDVLAASVTLSGNEDDNDVELGATYALNDQIEAAAEYLFADDEDVFSIGLNARF